MWPAVSRHGKGKVGGRFGQLDLVTSRIWWLALCAQVSEGEKSRLWAWTEPLVSGVPSTERKREREEEQDQGRKWILVSTHWALATCGHPGRAQERDLVSEIHSAESSANKLVESVSGTSPHWASVQCQRTEDREWNHWECWHSRDDAYKTFETTRGKLCHWSWDRTTFQGKEVECLSSWGKPFKVQAQLVSCTLCFAICQHAIGSEK